MALVNREKKTSQPVPSISNQTDLKQGHLCSKVSSCSLTSKSKKHMFTMPRPWGCAAGRKFPQVCLWESRNGFVQQRTQHKLRLSRKFTSENNSISITSAGGMCHMFSPEAKQKVAFRCTFGRPNCLFRDAMETGLCLRNPEASIRGAERMLQRPARCNSIQRIELEQLSWATMCCVDARYPALSGTSLAQHPNKQESFLPVLESFNILKCRSEWFQTVLGGAFHR